MSFAFSGEVKGLSLQRCKSAFTMPHDVMKPASDAGFVFLFHHPSCERG
jgi:hypothetical protein